MLKLSPDESFASIERIIGSARDLGFDGVIATNTSIGRDNLSGPGTHEAGGLSGKPIEKRSIDVIRFISNLTNSRFPIIGAGGIYDTESAIRKLDHFGDGHPHILNNIMITDTYPNKGRLKELLIYFFVRPSIVFSCFCLG